jgi:UDP-GlcNAc3NAcA epimerase
MQDGAMFYKNLALRPMVNTKDKYILCTIHRAENTDDAQRLKNIFEVLDIVAESKQVILPLHPRTKKILENLEIDISALTIIGPVGYLEMVWLIDHCDLVMTDSGGLQKEAFFFEKPCITLRDETEWVELIEHRFNVLAGAKKEKILDLYENFEFSDSFNVDMYGSGMASQHIVQELLKG